MTGSYKCSTESTEINPLLDLLKQSTLSATAKITRSHGAIVAASNSTAKEKAQADYVCDGTDDQVQIQEALDDFKNIKLLRGTFTVTDNITTPEYAVLSGMGKGNTTILQSKSTTLITGDPIITLSAHSLCEDFTLNGNGWTDRDIDTNGIKMASYSTVQNCEVLESTQYNIYTRYATGAKIINNIAHHTKYPICVLGETLESEWSNKCIVSNNIIYASDFYVKLRGAKDTLVSNNICTISSSTRSPSNNSCGIHLVGGDYPYKNISIIGNRIIDEVGTTTSCGIYVNPDANGLSNSIHIANNFISGCYFGISSSSPNLIIQNNMIMNSRNSGIHVASCSSPVIQNNKIYSGTLELLDVTNAVCDGNTIDAKVTYGLILSCVHASNVTGNQILNNTIYNATSIGLYIRKVVGNGSPLDTLVAYNNLSSNPTSIYDTSDGPTTYFKNIGYYTESTGSATIPTSQTSITVTHGLAATPTNVTVTPKGNIGSCWWDTPTSTTFIIHCSSAPAADVDVNWTAIV